jgi:hypothetical protein
MGGMTMRSVMAPPAQALVALHTLARADKRICSEMATATDLSPTNPGFQFVLSDAQARVLQPDARAANTPPQFMMNPQFLEAHGVAGVALENRTLLGKAQPVFGVMGNVVAAQVACYGSLQMYGTLK